MARTRCPKCGHSESDGRNHDRETYLELCDRCRASDDHSASRRVDVLEREAPHLLARPAMLEADDRNGC